LNKGNILIGLEGYCECAFLVKYGTKKAFGHHSEGSNHKT